MPQKRDKTLQTTMLVTGIIFLSKAVGFVRDMFRAAYFGTGIENDAYVAAYGLFYIPILLLTSGITSTMVPLYIDARSRGRRSSADRFASNAINLFALLAMVTSLLAMAFCRPMVHLIYPGFDQVRLDMTVRMTNIMMPSLVFVVVSVMLSSLLNATGHFVAAQLTGFALSLSVIVSTVWFSPVYGVDALSWGVFFAGILQVLILLPALRKDFRYSFVFMPGDPRFKRMLALGLPAMLSMAVTEVSHTIDRLIASGLNQGDVSAMDFAFRLITFITGVIGVPITTIMFSKMSERAAASDKKGIIDIVVQCIEVLSLALLPIVFIGSVLSEDIIRAVYMRGAFNEQSLSVTSGVFFAYLLGVISYCMSDLLNRAFHSMQKTRLTMWVALIVMGANATISIILSRFMGVNGLALGTVISSFLGTAMLIVLLRKRLGKLGFSSVAVELGKIFVASCAALIAALIIRNLLLGANDLLQTVLRLMAAGGGGVIVYLGFLKLLRVRQVDFLKLMFRRK